MYTQFFGNYLINQRAVTYQQLLNALDAHTTEGGIWNSFSGNIKDEHTDTDTDTDNEDKQPDYLVLGQVLVKQGALTQEQLEHHLANYRETCEILDLNFNPQQKNVILKLLTEINSVNASIPLEYIIDYLTLLFQNLIRYVGNDFTPLSILKMNEISASNCVAQQLECESFRVASALNMGDATAISFASRYAGEKFDEFNEYVKASMEDFLNLHNGLYLVNMSNEHALEMELLPPRMQDYRFLSPNTNTFLFSILFPFGLVHFICSVEAIL